MFYFFKCWHYDFNLWPSQLWILNATIKLCFIVKWAYGTKLCPFFHCPELHPPPQGFSLGSHRSGTSAQLKSAEEFMLWAKYRSTADAPSTMPLSSGFFFSPLICARHQGFSEFPHTSAAQRDAYTRPVPQRSLLPAHWNLVWRAPQK